MRYLILFVGLALLPLPAASQQIQKVDPDGVARTPGGEPPPNRDTLKPKPIIQLKGDGTAQEAEKKEDTKTAKKEDTKPAKKDHDFFILPESVSGEPGEWILIMPEVNTATKVKWKIGKGLKKIPIEKLFPDLKIDGVVVSGKKGIYEVMGWGAKGGEPSDLSICKVHIGVQPGPEPGPDPGPDPPTPPVPPMPTDPLTKAILAALNQETAADKVASTSALADLYTAAAIQVKASSLARVSDYHTSLKALRVATIGDKIPLVRSEVTKYLDSVLPRTVDAPLNDTNRNKCSQAFTEVAYALRACCP